MLLAFGVLLSVGIVGEIKHGMWGKSAKYFEFIVLWGVLGEVIADGGIFLFSSQLQIISDSENTALRKRADDAIATAKGFDLKIAESQRGTAEAQRDAATAKKDGAEANALAKKYQADIAKANEGMAVARKEAAQANERASKADTARVELQSKFAWRDPSDSQLNKIRDRLRPFKGQQFDVVTYAS
jgi:hypothetical protein